MADPGVRTACAQARPDVGQRRGRQARTQRRSGNDSDQPVEKHQSHRHRQQPSRHGPGPPTWPKDDGADQRQLGAHQRPGEDLLPGRGVRRHPISMTGGSGRPGHGAVVSRALDGGHGVADGGVEEIPHRVVGGLVGLGGPGDIGGAGKKCVRAGCCRPPRHLPLPPGIGQIGPERRRATPGATAVGADLDLADGPVAGPGPSP